MTLIGSSVSKSAPTIIFPSHSIPANSQRASGPSCVGPAPVTTWENQLALSVGDVEMELGTRLVRRAGKVVELTAVEFEVLEKLLRAAGRITTREELSREVLGRSPSPFDRSIDMHISNLRKKLGHQSGDAERIKTVRGVGYIYAQTNLTKGT